MNAAIINGITAGLFLIAGSAPAVMNSGGATLITNARIFDGERVIDATDVVIEDDVITSVGRNLTAPEGAETIDAAGRFLMPGMIDCHTHTFDTLMLEQELVFGVTTTLDMFTSTQALEVMRSTEGPAQADIFSSGILVTAPGGHGTQYGMVIPTITSPEEAAQFVADRIAEGSDFIKIVYDDGAEIGRSIPTVNVPIISAVVAASHKQNKLAVTHIHAYERACEAVECGVDGLVHTFIDQLPDDRLVTLMKKRDTFIIPTLSVIESVCGIRGGATLTEDESLSAFLRRADKTALTNTFPVPVDGPKRDYDVARRSVAQLHDAGVRILAGTDAPNPGTLHGASMHRELELLVDAGLEPIEALRAATSVPAAAFRLDDRGTIAPGKVADLVLVDGDPTKEIRQSRHIAEVWKDGVKVDRSARLQEVIAEKNRASQGDRGEALGLISDFESGAMKASFGAGWEESTDAMMGGKSVVELSVEKDEAVETENHMLRISGEIMPGPQFTWSGAMFYPGEAMFQPRNLSAKKSIVFRARGDGKTYRVMVFAQSLGRVPAIVSFQTSGEWKEYSLAIERFNRIDGSDIMGILFTGGPEEGAFEFEIDDVRLD